MVVNVLTTRHALSKIAREQDTTPLEVVKHAIQKTGSIHGAALRLGVNPNSVRYHLKRAGLTVKTVVTVEFEATGEN